MNIHKKQLAVAAKSHRRHRMGLGGFIWTCLALSGATLVRADGTVDIKIIPTATTTISTPGSYRVVANVTMNAGIVALTVNASNVTIDLGGHTLTGGGGAFIDGIAASAQSNVTVFGGTITGFSQYGVFVGDRAHVYDVNVRSCSAGGINVGNDAVVERCHATGNNTLGGFAGIRIGQSSVVKDCVSSNNVSSAASNTYGIYLGGSGCRAEGNLCENNTTPGGYAYGIFCNSVSEHIVNNVCRGNRSTSGTGDAWGIGSVVASDSMFASNNICDANTSAGRISGGIYTGKASTIENNVCTNNTANSSNFAYGITAGTGSTIRGNTCTGNSNTNNSSAYGIYALANSTIEGNTCSDNNEGPNALSLAVGISANAWCVVAHNTCGSNNATGADGISYGIYAVGGCLIKDNSCNAQTATGTGLAAGIFVHQNSRVVENHCTGNTGGSQAHGIRINSSGNLIARNFTQGNALGGAIFVDSTVPNKNRSQENLFREATGIDLANGYAPTSSGTGDLADITIP